MSKRLNPGAVVRLRVGPNGRDRSWTVGEVIAVEDGIRVRWQEYPESAALYRYARRELVLA